MHLESFLKLTLTFQRKKKSKCFEIGQNISDHKYKIKIFNRNKLTSVVYALTLSLKTVCTINL